MNKTCVAVFVPDVLCCQVGYRYGKTVDAPWSPALRRRIADHLFIETALPTGPAARRHRHPGQELYVLLPGDHVPLAEPVVLNSVVVLEATLN